MRDGGKQQLATQHQHQLQPLGCTNSDTQYSETLKASTSACTWCILKMLVSCQQRSIKLSKHCVIQFITISQHWSKHGRTLNHFTPYTFHTLTNCSSRDHIICFINLLSLGCIVWENVRCQTYWSGLWSRASGVQGTNKNCKSLDNNYMSCTICKQYVTTRAAEHTYKHCPCFQYNKQI